MHFVISDENILATILIILDGRRRGHTIRSHILIDINMSEVSQMLQRIEFMGIPMHIANTQSTVEEIDNRIQARCFTQHVVVNVAKLVNIQHDERLRESVVDCDIINIDGMGVVWAARFFGHPVPERIAGIDLFKSLIELAVLRGYPVFLLGAKDNVVSGVSKKLVSKYPKLKIAGYHHGYFWDDEAAMVEKIKRSKARLLFVAITSPKKEMFIHKWREELNVDFVMGVGGTFDIFAGNVRRAPLWVQNIGCEWLFRVLQEPKRLGGRYVKTNFRFLLLVMKEVMGVAKRKIINKSNN